MQSIKQILGKFDPLKDKYISREFQSYGYWLAKELEDLKRKALYIKLAKTIHRSILENALSYVKDARVESKARLFMWKLKELGAFNKDEKSDNAAPLHSK